MSSLRYLMLRYLRELAELHGEDDPAAGATVRKVAAVGQVEESIARQVLRELSAQGLVRIERCLGGWAGDVCFATECALAEAR